MSLNSDARNSIPVKTDSDPDRKIQVKVVDHTAPGAAGSGMAVVSGRAKVNTTPNGPVVTSKKTFTTTPRLICAGADNLANRALLFMEPENNGIIWSFDPLMPFGHKLFKDGMIVLDAGPDVDIWGKTTSGSVDMIISEKANG